MALPLEPPLEPMLSKPSEDIPSGDGWLYEPKWDGFRAICFIDGPDVFVCSRRGQPLARYFPELVELLAVAFPRPCVVDGEIIIATPSGLDFDALQTRLHPASSRVRKLAAETPSSFVAFDLLADDQTDVRSRPLTERRSILAERGTWTDRILLTPQTADRDEAAEWFVRYEGAGLDGVVAKRAEAPYVHGERTMVKIKHRRTADCVVGGYRLAKSGDGIGSLLLGLYDAEGTLFYVGHAASFKAKERRELLERLKPLAGPGGFGHEWGPGGQSRWNAGRESQEWVSLQPELVCEVSFDHMQGPRFRHATRFERWRPDRAPSTCTFDQLTPPTPFSLADVRNQNA